MTIAAIVAGVAAGVAELVKLGIVSAQYAHEAEEVLVRAMRPTPSAEEVDRLDAALARLRDPDTDPAPAPPPEGEGG